MISDREKLLALIQKAKDECANDYSDHTENEYIADTLLDNYVTFAKDTDVPSKWISVDNPPEDWKGEGGYLTNYYVYTQEYGTDIGNYMKTADRWFCMGIPCKVTHWMQLPQSPREE